MNQAGASGKVHKRERLVGRAWRGGWSVRV